MSGAGAPFQGHRPRSAVSESSTGPPLPDKPDAYTRPHGPRPAPQPAYRINRSVESLPEPLHRPSVDRKRVANSYATGVPTRRPVRVPSPLRPPTSPAHRVSVGSMPKLTKSPLPYPLDPEELASLSIDGSPVPPQHGFSSPQIVPPVPAHAGSSVSSTSSPHDADDHRSSRSSIPDILLPGISEIRNPHLVLPLDLPEIPPLTESRPLFTPEQLTLADLENCQNLSCLSSLADWLYKLVSAIDAEFTTATAAAALAKLFTFWVPVLNWMDSEGLAAQVIQSLQDQGFIEKPSSASPDDALVLIPSVPVNGVITLVSGRGCYSGRLGPGQCYSPRCLKEERPALPSPSFSAGRSNSVRTVSGGRSLGTGEHGPYEMDWVTYWGILPSQLGDIDKQLLKRQYAVHELITSEALYVRDLQVYVQVYGELEHVVPAVMANQKQFCEQVFHRIRAVLVPNVELLMAFRQRQRQQGPYMDRVADLVILWVRSAAKAYWAYADDYLSSDQTLRSELGSSKRLADWMGIISRDARLKGVPHSFYFSRVIPRLARYGLLLEAIRKVTPLSSPEHNTLGQAIEAVTGLAKQCDERIARVQRLLDVQNLHAHVVFKDDAVSVNLHLEDRKRKLIKRGTLQRRSGYKMEWLPTQVLLLDNYLILSKTREGAKGTAFYITKKPIPLSLLVVEAADEDGVVKVASRLTFTTTEKSKKSPKAAKATDGQGSPIARPAPQTAVTSLDNSKDVLYPIRITDLANGGASYTLYASTPIERDSWCKAIIEAKRALSASSFAHNAEPMYLRLLSDSFAYKNGELPVGSVATPSVSLDRILAPPGLIVARGRVNCVTYLGQGVYFAGLEYGLWLCTDPDSREWTKCLNLSKITQIQMVEDFNLLVLLSAGHLIWYRLDEVLAHGLSTHRPEKGKTVPLGHRLTRHKKVTSFRIAFIKDRLLVLYQQADATGSSKTIKAVEPVRASAQLPPSIPVNDALGTLPGDNRSKIPVDHFRDVDRLSVPTDILGVTPFHFSLILHTTKGFEYIDFETKVPRLVPVEPAGTSSSTFSFVSAALPNTTSSQGRPLGVFRVTAARLLLCYEACCFACDNNGVFQKDSVTKFLGKAQAVNYSSPYLVILSPELVEIRKIEFDHGGVILERAPLMQVLTGKDIHLLDETEGQIRLAMTHPRMPERQIVVELLRNEFVSFDPTSTLAGL